jgi:ribosomal protein L16 Arg81 hydroxylase
MPLHEYVEMVQSTTATNRFYLVGTNDLLQRPGAALLWEDIGALPSFLNPRERLKGASLWFGPAGTITPLHHDTMNILFTQIVGRKQLVLVPPTQTHLLYNDLNVFSEVDAERPDLQRFPRFARATPVTVLVEPGQALFIPVGWWHHVRAIDVSISVSFTNFAFPNSYRWMNPLIGQRS